LDAGSSELPQPASTAVLSARVVPIARSDRKAGARIITPPPLPQGTGLVEATDLPTSPYAHQAMWDVGSYGDPAVLPSFAWSPTPGGWPDPRLDTAFSRRDTAMTHHQPVLVVALVASFSLLGAPGAEASHLRRGPGELVEGSWPRVVARSRLSQARSWQGRLGPTGSPPRSQYKVLHRTALLASVLAALGRTAHSRS